VDVSGVDREQGLQMFRRQEMAFAIEELPEFQSATSVTGDFGLGSSPAPGASVACCELREVRAPTWST
jgi:hypothetical protein